MFNANPDQNFNFKLSPAIKLNQAIASLCNPSIEMAEVSQRGFEITAYNTQTTKVAEIHFLKTFRFINFHGRNPIFSLDHISQILIHTVIISHVDRAMNLFFIFGHANTKPITFWMGNSNVDKKYAAPIPITSSSYRYYAFQVKKHADADTGSGNSSDQNRNNAGNDAVNPNAAPSVHADYVGGSGIKSSNNGSGNGSSEGGNSNGNADNGQKVKQHPIRIHRIEVGTDGSSNFRPTINTDLIASQYNSWKEFAAAIRRVWADINGLKHDNNAPTIKQMDNLNCWPGAVTSFGRFEDGKFIQCHWVRDRWEDVKTLITDVRVFSSIPVLLEEDPFLRDEDVNDADNTQHLQW